MKNQLPNQTIKVDNAGNNICALHSIFGMNLKDTAGNARYKTQVLMPLCASFGIRFADLKIIPAEMLKAISIKLIMVDK